MIEQLEKKTGVKCISSIDGIKYFDICLMNPPYNGSLELKFLEKVIDICDDVVTVQPISWLQDPLNMDKKTSKFNKYENSICKHINDVEILKNASKLFNISANVDIAIYHCNKNGGYDYKSIMWDKIDKKEYDKYYKSANDFPKLMEYDETTDKAFVTIKTFANDARTTRYNIVAPNTYQIIYNKKLPNGDPWYSKKYKSKSLAKEKPFGIYFNTYEEAKNFYNSCLTECYKYIVSVFKKSGGVPLKYLPFMGDYKKPWDNERFFEYYNLDKEKQEEIISSMQQFMNNDYLIK